MTDLREEVGAFYGRALKQDGAGAAPSAARLASDYEEGQLDQAPADAVANSFGCGNPLALASLRPGQCVLDLGSGAGLDLILAAEKVGADGQVIGVDLSEEMIERARANVAAAGHANVEIRKGYIEELPVEDGSVDHVMSNCVINLSPDKAAVVHEIHRVLRPGGTMLVSDIVVDSLPDWVLDNRDLYAACVAGATSEAQYLAYARDAGLDEVAVVDELVYDEATLRTMLDGMLPIDLGAIAARLGTDVESLAALAAAELAGRIRSVKVRARRP